MKPTVRSVSASRPTPGRSVHSPHEAGSALGGTSPFHSTTSAASGRSARPSAANPAAIRTGPPRRSEEEGRHRRQPQERLPREHGPRDAEAGQREGGGRAVARVRVYAFEREQREQDRQVVGEQRERRPEEVGRQHEGQREREGGQRRQRGGLSQQPQQRQRRAVGDDDVEQPQLPQLEAHELAPAGHHHVEQRRLGRGVVREVEPLAKQLDRRQLVGAGVRAVEGLDLDRQALQHGHADQEREGQQQPVHQPSGSGRGGRKRGTSSTARIAAMMSAAPSQPVAVSRSSLSSQPNRPANAGSEARISAVRAGGACF